MSANLIQKVLKQKEIKIIQLEICVSKSNLFQTFQWKVLSEVGGYILYSSIDQIVHLPDLTKYLLHDCFPLIFRKIDRTFDKIKF